MHSINSQTTENRDKDASAARLGLSGILLLLLAACGGGGSGGAPPIPPNTPPTANAGADQSVTENDTVQLAGQGSDPNGGSVSFVWSQDSGPTVTFSSTTDPAATVEPPMIAIGDEESIVLRLTVTDGGGATASDTLVINVASADFVVFTARKDDPGVSELYKYDTQTDTIIKLNGQLVVGGSINRISISPDGQFVAYSADQETNQEFELFVVAADGSGLIKINAPLVAGGDVTEFQWSPDSQQVVYGADGDIDGVGEVYLVDRDGGNHAKINGNTAGVVRLGIINWSPDGRYIAQGVIELVGNRFLGINTHDTSTGAFSSVRISNVPASGTIIAPYVWSPDGSSVAYVADVDTDDVFELYAALPDGSAVSKISGSLVSGGDVTSGAWSPDGAQLVYRASQDTVGVPELYVSAADGTGNVKISGPLVAAGQVLGNGGWSPDGAWFAYSAIQDTAGVVEIYASSPDGSINNKLSGPLVVSGNASLGRGNQLWAPDSSRLMYGADQFTNNVIELFVSSTDGAVNNQVTVTPVAGGRLASSGKWSADGSHIVYTSRQDDAAVGELYMASPDGLSNLKISGALVGGGGVSGFFDWSP